IVRVAVEHPALAFDPTSLHDVAARRAGRLTKRLLVEISGLGVEGGKYDSPLATVNRSDDGRALVLHLRSSVKEGGAYELAQRLLAQASEGSAAYDSNWSRIVSAVSVPSIDEVQVDLRAAGVLPETSLEIPLANFACAESLSQPFSLLSRDKSVARFV